MTFSTTGYTISGGTAIALGGATAAANTITTDSAATATISTPLSGSNGLTKAGAGILILDASNTLTGGINIDAGTLRLDNTGALNSNAVAFGSSSTGILQLNGKTVTINGLTTAATAPVVENANATAATLTVNNSGANTFAGTLRDGTASAALTLTKTGAGTLTLSGANAYTGTTNINGGAISVTANANLGSTAPAAGITFSGGTLLIGGSSSNFSTSRAITLNGGGTLDSGAVGNTMTFMTGSTVTNGANLLTLQGSGAGSLADVIGNGSGGVTKSGTGTWMLSGSNSYTGLTTISQGVPDIQHGNVLEVRATERASPVVRFSKFRAASRPPQKR